MARTTCSRGHGFNKTKDTPVCPICWPGRYKKMKKRVLKKPISKKTASGAYTHYHKDGSIWAQGKIKKGKMDGYWEWYRKDGTTMRTGHFKNGTQTGEWTTYDKDGRVVKVTAMK